MEGEKRTNSLGKEIFVESCCVGDLCSLPKKNVFHAKGDYKEKIEVEGKEKFKRWTISGVDKAFGVETVECFCGQKGRKKKGNCKRREQTRIT